MNDKKLAIHILHYVDMLGDAAKALTQMPGLIDQLETTEPELYVSLSEYINESLVELTKLSYRMTRDIGFLSDGYFDFNIGQTNENEN